MVLLGPPHLYNESFWLTPLPCSALPGPRNSQAGTAPLWGTPPPPLPATPTSHLPMCNGPWCVHSDLCSKMPNPPISSSLLCILFTPHCSSRGSVSVHCTLQGLPNSPRKCQYKPFTACTASPSRIAFHWYLFHLRISLQFCISAPYFISVPYFTSVFYLQCRLQLLSRLHILSTQPTTSSWNCTAQETSL